MHYIRIVVHKASIPTGDQFSPKPKVSSQYRNGSFFCKSYKTKQVDI